MTIDQFKTWLYVYVMNRSQDDRGLSPEQVEAITKRVKAKAPQFNQEKYDQAMFGNTVTIVKNGEVETTYIFAKDLYRALVCAVEDRNLKVGEWD